MRRFCFALLVACCCVGSVGANEPITIGETVQLTILRDGQEITVPVTLGEEPQA